MRGPRVIVLQLKRIGDLLLTAPALATLRRRLPEAEVTLVVPGPMQGLAGCLAGVDQVMGYGAIPQMAAVASTLVWGDWDLCLDFTGTDRSALLSRLSRARRRIGYRRSSGGLRRWGYTDFCEASVRDLHTLDYHGALVDEAVPMPGVGHEGAALRIAKRVADGVGERIEREGLGGGYVVMHPGTARREKFWPVERWIELGRWLTAGGRRVVLTGTGQGLEAEDIRRMLAVGEVPWVDLTGQLELPELAEWIRRADAALGVDSMAMHLAALWERPQVVLFGPTNPFHWRPRHPKAFVLVGSKPGVCVDFFPKMKGAEMNLISTEQAIDATRLALAVES